MTNRFSHETKRTCSLSPKIVLSNILLSVLRPPECILFLSFFLFFFFFVCLFCFFVCLLWFGLGVFVCVCVCIGRSVRSAVVNPDIR